LPLFLQGFGEVAGVALGELGLVQVQNALAEAFGLGVARLVAAGPRWIPVTPEATSSIRMPPI